jgi:hypothetical protein
MAERTDTAGSSIGLFAEQNMNGIFSSASSLSVRHRAARKADNFRESHDFKRLHAE